MDVALHGEPARASDHVVLEQLAAGVGGRLPEDDLHAELRDLQLVAGVRHGSPLADDASLRGVSAAVGSVGGLRRRVCPLLARLARVRLLLNLVVALAINALALWIADGMF